MPFNWPTAQSSGTGNAYEASTVSPQIASDCISPPEIGSQPSIGRQVKAFGGIDFKVVSRPNRLSEMASFGLVEVRGR
jgi:hypothetical protein